MRRIASFVIVAAVLLLPGAPALAQDVPDLPAVPEPPVPMPHVPGTIPPPPDLPAVPLPPDAEPTVAVTAPLTNEVCGVAATATANGAKVPSLVALGLALAKGPAIEAIPSTSPYVSLLGQPCTALAGPTRLSECAPDREAATIVETVLGLPGLSATGAVFGLTGLRVDLPKTGAAFDTLAAADDAGLGGGAAASADSLYDSLDCQDVLDASFEPPALPDLPDVGVELPLASDGAGPTSVTDGTPTSSALRAVLPLPGAAPGFAVTDGSPEDEIAAPTAPAGPGAATDAVTARPSSSASPWDRLVQAFAVMLLGVAGFSIVQSERRPRRR